MSGEKQSRLGASKTAGTRNGGKHARVSTAKYNPIGAARQIGFLAIQAAQLAYQARPAVRRRFKKLSRYLMARTKGAG